MDKPTYMLFPVDGDKHKGKNKLEMDVQVL